MGRPLDEPETPPQPSSVPTEEPDGTPVENPSGENGLAELLGNFGRS